MAIPACMVRESDSALRGEYISVLHLLFFLQSISVAIEPESALDAHLVVCEKR
jgi:hypothetical protein